MATSSKIQLSLDHRGVFGCPGIVPEAVKTTTDLLQQNHEQHHIFFNDDGFHNHIVHHLLSLYALASSASNIQRRYEDNKSYQRPAREPDARVVDQLHDPAFYQKCLGDGQHYNDFLAFFQGEMEQKGWEAVLNEYLFSGDERAEDMLVRMFMGIVHPLIHLGFGLEFRQPAIIAEALAQAAVHQNWLGAFFFAAEQAAAATAETSGRALVALLGDVRADPALRTAARWDDGDKLRDGILTRAPHEMIRYASRWRVDPDDLERRTAEMINAAAYMVGGAQRPPKVVKVDFFLMHCLNCSIFHSTFLGQTWLSAPHKARLLEWKGRFDLAMYASRGAPPLLIDEIAHYTPRSPSGVGGDPWGSIIDRVGRHADDGHASKLIRALAHGQEACRRYDTREDFPITSALWLQLGHMAIDSVERPEPSWIRSAGFDQAWESYGDRDGSGSGISRQGA